MKKILILLAIFTFASTVVLAQSKEAQRSKNLKETSFAVKGMTCSGCVANVEKSLKKIDGVTKYEVSLETNSAKVEFDPSKTSETKIAEEMNKTHYKFSKEASENKGKTTKKLK